VVRGEERWRRASRGKLTVPEIVDGVGGDCHFFGRPVAAAAEEEDCIHVSRDQYAAKSSGTLRRQTKQGRMRSDRTERERREG
jgi:hypothetical protein